MTAAKRRALDYLRHEQVIADKTGALAFEFDFRHASAGDELGQRVDAALDDTIGDDLLRLMFTACHPVLSPQARCALTLRLMSGLTTEEIARAYLKPEPTIAQRIVRAKRALAAARVPFEVPSGPDLVARLPPVLEVLYLIFNEGYAATSGEDWMRPALCEDALRLGRILAELMSGESEVHGLVALMEIQASRFAARISPDGEPVLLLEPLGSTADPPWPRCAGSRRGATGSARPVPHPGGDRRLSCACDAGGRDRLGAHRRAL